MKAEIPKLKEALLIKQKKPNILENIACLNAEIFAIQIANESKTQKLKKLLEESKEVSQLEKVRESKINEFDVLQKELNDISLLFSHLQNVRLDPSTQTVSDLIETRRQYLSKMKKMKILRQQLQGRIEGQESFGILTERITDLKTIRDENIMRERRTQLNLILQMKKMRGDIFQNSMKNLLK